MNESCNHEKVSPKFDEEAATELDTAEIRKRWPRFFGTCPDCGWTGIMYASLAHYVYGDW